MVKPMSKPFRYTYVLDPLQSVHIIITIRLDCKGTATVAQPHRLFGGFRP